MESKPPAYTCPNCLVPTCTPCHASHGEYTCTEHKATVDGEALKKVKLELKIKDCPKCSTPLEKAAGCNHMTCGGCKAHMCWVCMAVLEDSAPYHEHLRQVHGDHGGEQFVVDDEAGVVHGLAGVVDEPVGVVADDLNLGSWHVQ